MVVAVVPQTHTHSHSETIKQKKKMTKAKKASAHNRFTVFTHAAFQESMRTFPNARALTFWSFADH